MRFDTHKWMRSIVKFVATKKCMSTALALATDKNSELFSYSFDQLTRAIRGLLDRAIATGEIRDDISPEDLLRALVGMCYMQDQPGWQTSVLRRRCFHFRASSTRKTLLPKKADEIIALLGECLGDVRFRRQSGYLANIEIALIDAAFHV